MQVALRSDSNSPVCGSGPGPGVVVTAAGSNTLAVRDSGTGARLRQIHTAARVDALWADSTKLVILDRDLTSSAPLTVLHMGWEH